jgi:predicted lysophospholipase L1 biosynthesis ABC-type transport system permease subunit
VAPVEPSAPKDQLAVITTMGSIIISLCTALFSALGFLFVNGPKAKRGLWPKIVAVASGASAAISIYFGYLLYQAVMEMGSLQISFPDFPAITWARQYQFIAFMLSVMLFGDFAIDTFFLEDGSDS